MGTPRVPPGQVIDLRSWRLRAGYTNLSQLARQIGYKHPSGLGHMDLGMRNIPAAKLRKLEELLGPDPPLMTAGKKVKPAKQQESYWIYWWEYSLMLSCTSCGESYPPVTVRSTERVRITSIPRFKCARCGGRVLLEEVVEEHARKPSARMYRRERHAKKP